jgi:hypothetical protein
MLNNTTRLTLPFVFGATASLLLASTAICADQSNSSNTPLFDAFKRFCRDTGAEPERVRSAVEVSGGKSRGPAATLPDQSMTTETWDVAVQSHQLLVSFGSARLPVKTARDFVSCSVSSFVNEDPSVTAIQDWVAVPPIRVSPPNPSSRFSPDLTQYHYGFEELGSVHVIPKDQSELRMAASEGRYWGLVLLHTPRSASVQLTHELPDAAGSP